MKAERRPTPLPTFLIIGAQKSGTRWLRFNLGRHEEIFIAPKELEYFNSEAFEEFGLDRYSRQFEGWDGEEIVGEATPGYMMWRENVEQIAARIDATLPDVRLIAQLKNPVDRIRSAVLHHSQRERLSHKGSALSYLGSTAAEEDPWGIVTGSWYAVSLKPFVDRFGSRLLVVLHDDVLESPAEVYRLACEHVGASAEFVPPGLKKTRFSNHDVEPAVGEMMRDALTPGERAVLMGFVRDEIDALEKLLDLDLSRWRLGGEYTPGLKTEAVEALLGGRESAEEVAKRLSVPALLLRAWGDEVLAAVPRIYK